MYQFIVNPGAGAGRGYRIWKRLEHQLEMDSREYRVFFTEHQGDAAEIAKVLTAERDDAKVIVTTIYNPAGNMKLPSTLNKIVEDIIENMNAIIEKRAGKYDYEIADVYQSSVTSHLQKDGVHPDSQGQQIIADLVCKEYEK